jgi:transcriptional regulator NrdR family protein
MILSSDAVQHAAEKVSLNNRKIKSQSRIIISTLISDKENRIKSWYKLIHEPVVAQLRSSNEVTYSKTICANSFVNF